MVKQKKLIEVYHLTRLENLATIGQLGLQPEHHFADDITKQQIYHPDYYNGRVLLTGIFEDAKPANIAVSRRNANFFHTYPVRANSYAAMCLLGMAIATDNHGLVVTSVDRNTPVFDAQLFLQAFWEFVIRKERGEQIPNIEQRVRELAMRYWIQTTTLGSLHNDYQMGEFFAKAHDDPDLGVKKLNQQIYFRAFQYQGQNPDKPKFFGTPEVIVNGEFKHDKIGVLPVNKFLESILNHRDRLRKK